VDADDLCVCMTSLELALVWLARVKVPRPLEHYMCLAVGASEKSFGSSDDETVPPLAPRTGGPGPPPLARRLPPSRSSDETHPFGLMSVGADDLPAAPLVCYSPRGPPLAP
jgi:hypothetical protein